MTNFRRRRPSTTTKPLLESQEVITPMPKFQFVPRRRTPKPKPKLTIQNIDQTIESSNQQSKEEDIPSDTTEFNDIATALHLIHPAPLPSLKTTPIPKTTKKPHYKRVHSRRTMRPSTSFPINSSTTKFLLKKKPIQKLGLKNSEFEGFDDQSVLQLGQIPENSKVLLHSNGVIECLDQGNFPHPISCKKFISCAKMETGVVLGWEYTCPINLSFDPIGGICNWSPELGCNE